MVKPLKVFRALSHDPGDSHDKDHYFHFRAERTESLRGNMTCPGSYS